MSAPTSTPTDPQRYLTARQAAAYSSLGLKTIRRQIAAGRLPVGRVGRRVLIDREDLDRLARPAAASVA